MATRRPLVRIGGRTRQLPADDVVAGVNLRLAVYQANGSAVVLVLNSGYQLPVMTHSGVVVVVELING